MTRHHGPYSVEHDCLDEVLEAVNQRLPAPPRYSSSQRQITFVSRHDPTPQFRRRFREFQMYVRARYAVRMLVVGGGYGCIRLTMDLHAHEIENIKRFLRNLKHKDPDLHARTRLLKLEYFEDEAISQRVDLTPTTSYPPPPGKDDSAPPRLDTTADLHVFITNQLNRLEGLLNRCERRGADLLIQFKNTLRQLLPSLVPGAVKELFDEDAWRYLRHLGDRIRALPCDVAKNAASVGEMILAAVEKAKELKYPSHP